MSNRVKHTSRCGYHALAVAVVARAIADLRSPTSDLDYLTQRSAQSFLQTPTHPRLHLWCAWLDLTPDRVCAAYDVVSRT